MRAVGYVTALALLLEAMVTTANPPPPYYYPPPNLPQQTGRPPVAPALRSYPPNWSYDP